MKVELVNSMNSADTSSFELDESTWNLLCEEAKKRKTTPEKLLTLILKVVASEVENDPAAIFDDLNGDYHG